MGRSFSVSCSCKLMVCVETTAFFFCATANRMAGIRYARRFADAGAGLHREMLAVLQRARHGHGHFLLLRAELKISRLGQNPVGEKISSTWETKSALVRRADVRWKKSLAITLTHRGEICPRNKIC